MKKTLGLFLGLILLLAMLISGCDGRDEPENDQYTIVTSFYPIYIATINVARDIPGVEVLNMTKAQTGCLHDYQLTPQDLKILEQADAFVINGAGMEAFMSDVINQQADLKIIEASQGIMLLKDAGGEDNPHVWVSVTNAIKQVDNIAKQLSLVNPDHADLYAQNAEAYIQKLETLKTKMHQELSGIKNKDIITFHEAFPYFAEEFDLNIAAVIERDPGTAQSPKELEDIIAVIKESEIKALFVEPQYSAKAAKTISQETGATIYDLDPAVTGIAAADGYEDYIEIMSRNLSVLKEALK